MTKWHNPFHRGRALREEAETAAQGEQAARSAKRAADAQHDEALTQYGKATALADILGGMDRRNHYSASLTQAFRGRTT